MANSSQSRRDGNLERLNLCTTAFSILFDPQFNTAFSLRL